MGSCLQGESRLSGCGLCECLIVVQASPGNLQQLEGVLFGHNDALTSTCVMAIKLTNENGQRMVGVAYAEPTQRKLGVSEFLENDQFSNVEVYMQEEVIYF